MVHIHSHTLDSLICLKRDLFLCCSRQRMRDSNLNLKRTYSILLNLPKKKKKRKTRDEKWKKWTNDTKNTTLWRNILHCSVSFRSSLFCCTREYQPLQKTSVSLHKHPPIMLNVFSSSAAMTSHSHLVLRWQRMSVRHTRRTWRVCVCVCLRLYVRGSQLTAWRTFLYLCVHAERQHTTQPFTRLQQ